MFIKKTNGGQTTRKCDQHNFLRMQRMEYRINRFMSSYEQFSFLTMGTIHKWNMDHPYFLKDVKKQSMAGGLVNGDRNWMYFVY